MAGDVLHSERRFLVEHFVEALLHLLTVAFGPKRRNAAVQHFVRFTDVLRTRFAHFESFRIRPRAVMGLNGVSSRYISPQGSGMEARESGAVCGLQPLEVSSFPSSRAAFAR
jgi:hypothetical protein